MASQSSMSWLIKQTRPPLCRAPDTMLLLINLRADKPVLTTCLDGPVHSGFSWRRKNFCFRHYKNKHSFPATLVATSEISVCNSWTSVLGQTLSLTRLKGCRLGLMGFRIILEVIVNAMLSHSVSHLHSLEGDAQVEGHSFSERWQSSSCLR